jgi:hypothetical protein
MTQKPSQAALSHWRIMKAMGIRWKKDTERERLEWIERGKIEKYKK